MRAGGLLRGNSPATRESTGGWLNDVRAALLSVVFPAGCRICEQLLTGATRIPIRNDCLGSVAPAAAGPPARTRAGLYPAALVAKPLAKRLGLPYKSVLLTKTRTRPDKHSLSYEERW